MFLSKIYTFLNNSRQKIIAMIFGMTLEPFKGITVKQLMFLMRLLKLGHLEINFTMMPVVKEFVENLGNTTTTFHMPIFSRNGFDIGSRDSKFQKNIDEVISFINTNKEKLNLKYTLLHPIEDPNANFNLFVERAARINTPVVIENIMGISDQEFLDFFFKTKEEIGNKVVGIALDGPHKFVNYKGNWLDFPDEFIKNIEYIHVSDCTKNADLHLPLGLGEFPYEQFFSFLKKQKYEGIILHEILPSEGRVREVMNSFLHCVKSFSNIKYQKLKTRYALLEPIIQHRIDLAFKEFNKTGKQLLVREFNYDFIKN